MDDLMEYVSSASPGPWTVVGCGDEDRSIVDANGRTVADGVSFDDAQLIVRLRAASGAISDSVALEARARASNLEARRLVRRIAAEFDIQSQLLVQPASHANILGAMNGLLKRVRLLKSVEEAATDLVHEVLHEAEADRDEVRDLARKVREAVRAYNLTSTEHVARDG